ncbi:MAG: hypothetical protein K8H84_12345 [Sulfuricella denitrificans]|nr:hypothetical protein [Sulfuricella denitrificans]
MKIALFTRLQAAFRRMLTRPVASPAPALPLAARIRWALRRRAALMGWPGMLAVGVLAICPAFYFSAIRPAQERLTLARHSVAAAQQLKLSGTASDSKAHTPAAQLEAFYRIFPQENSYPEWLEKLGSVAESHGISLNEGEYKATRDKVGRLVSYQITLPLNGQYPQIRSLLAALPAEIPAVALKQVQFERQKVASPNVEARIRLVLFLEHES